MKDENEPTETDKYICMSDDNYRYLSKFLVDSNNQEKLTTDNRTSLVKNYDGRYLSASALAKNFMEKIENCLVILELTHCHIKTKIRRNSPAIQMNVKMKETHVEFSVEIYLALTLRCKGYFIPIRNVKFYWEIDDNDHSIDESLSSKLEEMKNEHPILFEMAFYNIKTKYSKVLQNFADNDSRLMIYFYSELKDLLQKLEFNFKNYHYSNILNDATLTQQRYSTKEDDNMVDSINICKSWHGSSHFITEIENFATKYVIPHDRLKEARQKTQSIIGDIVKQLKKNKIFVTRKFFGQDLDLNFTFRDIKLDVMLVWDVRKIIEKIPSPIADLCFMMVKSGKSIPIPTVTDKDDHNRYLIPSFLLKYFKEKIDMCCGEYDREHWNIKTELRGQSILMKVSIQNEGDDSASIFSIRIFPTLKVINEEYYECNCYDKFGQPFILSKDFHSWRRSIRIEENREISKFSSEDLNREKILRVFMCIRYCKPPFSRCLSSHHFINTFINLFKNPRKWSLFFPRYSPLLRTYIKFLATSLIANAG
ncbi:hypothetical protein HELRODRAFT_183966 [Helobdella robusta]|uniref:Uncharacterized protein n=1 Tax=Helobdella robusta TaxID=6412 RepID=T1FKD3_HELRO|nr:hypothetical protein HELRODRAFT_183966 [Helobdella robusta]ESO09699.1 hypothetical protein HELRODRAFT_183966 [Helobdella robusta]